MANIVELWLDGNQIGDVGLTAFADAVRSGALASLTELDLASNNIGDAGVKDCSEAFSSGALPTLQFVFAGGNPGSIHLVLAHGSIL
jgi:hypothetical protein